MSRRRSRVLQVSTPVLRRARIERALDVARNLAVSSVAKRLVSATPHAPITTPLWFEAPVTHVIKSAAVKEQEAAAAVAAKASRCLQSSYHTAFCRITSEVR